MSESEIIARVIYAKPQVQACAQKRAQKEPKNESRVHFFLDAGKHNLHRFFLLELTIIIFFSEIPVFEYDSMDTTITQYSDSETWPRTRRMA